MNAKKATGRITDSPLDMRIVRLTNTQGINLQVDLPSVIQLLHLEKAG